MTEKCTEILKRAEHWPQAAQEEVIASLEAIEREYIGDDQISPADRAALIRSADDKRNGRISPDDDAEALLVRYRRA